MVLLLYAPVPMGARGPRLQLWGCVPTAPFPVPGGGGSALGRCSETRNLESVAGKVVGRSQAMTCDPCHSVPVLYVSDQLRILLLDSLERSQNKHT